MTTDDQREQRRRAALNRLAALLDRIDADTRHPGEPPLREAVAEQARAELRRMGPRP